MTILLVGLSVVIHYEALYTIAKLMGQVKMRPRRLVAFGVIGALMAHVVEIWLFAMGYYVLIQSGQAGTLGGEFAHDIQECGYYSYVTYTTLGFGDITPSGPLRFVTGMEALTGLVMITWTASFMYLQMERLWKNHL
ncbi:potassium channel family protein [Candidatus Nitronereus thalassa]|uniref:Potassium channel family protein n=1 Tax=Candidatus Nitronereus thalassa TaxID=3020898 RepID=A0ABU3K9X8_9BACT|nr:potassium channel family protein [Candidatus Nitronereus thalassa]MDT7043226.1 potassium channel family protein [Candidatus Nitronereus thalassa]